jgi:hypothetical protein
VERLGTSLAQQASVIFNRAGILATAASLVVFMNTPAAHGQANVEPASTVQRATSPALQLPAPTASAATIDQGSGHGLGFTAGLLSGLGFAYRRHFANKLGIQLGGIAWGNRTDSFVSFGAEAIRTLSHSDRTRFYGVVGTSLFRDNGQFLDYSGCYADPGRPPAESCAVEVRRTTGSLAFGAGIGMEFSAGRHIGVSFEVPLSLMLDLDTSDRFNRKGIYPIPSMSVIYYF